MFLLGVTLFKNNNSDKYDLFNCENDEFINTLYCIIIDLNTQDAICNLLENAGTYSNKQPFSILSLKNLSFHPNLVYPRRTTE
jgi:hypothetical protein